MGHDGIGIGGLGSQWGIGIGGVGCRDDRIAITMPLQETVTSVEEVAMALTVVGGTGGVVSEGRSPSGAMATEYMLDPPPLW